MSRTINRKRLLAILLGVAVMIALALVIGGASKAHAEGGDPVPTGINFTPVSDNLEIWSDQARLTSYGPADEFINSTVKLTFEGGSTKTYTFKKVEGKGYDFYDDNNNSIPYIVSLVWWDSTENDVTHHDFPREKGAVYEYKAVVYPDWYTSIYSTKKAKVTLKGYCYRTTIDGITYNVCDERFPDIYKSEYYGKAYVASVDKSKTGDITIPANVKMADGKTRPISFIGSALFYENTNIGKVTLPSTVTHIYKHAFCDSSLSSINLPYGLKKIGYVAFNGCENLKNITIPRTVTYIDEAAFSNSGIEEVLIPETVETIKDRAFGSFTYNKETGEFTTVGELTIYGKKESEAEKYANKYGFTFVGFETALGVDALIDAIGDVDENSEESITVARDMYDKLSDDQKGNVTKLNVLEAAEIVLSKTKADKAAAANVDKLIGNIGSVSKNSKTKITTARNAYNKLTADQKKLVTKLDVLTAAEKRYPQIIAAEEAKIKAAQAASVGKLKAKSLKKKKVQLTWSKANGVSGYEVYQSNKKNGKFKKIATLKASVTKWKSKKIKKGKKAFFKVRSFTNISGKNTMANSQPPQQR